MSDIAVEIVPQENIELEFAGDVPSNYVPYSGALADVDLGAFGITALLGTFGNIYDKTDIDSLLTLYYTKTETDNKFALYYTSAQVDTIFLGYYTKTQIDNFFLNYYTKSEVDTLALSYEKLANKGVANGYASLGSDGKVPISQLPSSLGVISVFGRTGVVVATNGDYTTDQITETLNKVFVTPAEKTAITHTNRTALDAVTGTNTGDETYATIISKLTFTPEDVANKKTTMTGNETSGVFYLTAKAIYDWATGLFQTLANKVTAWQVTPDDTHYPSEKLVKDGLNAKLNLDQTTPQHVINGAPVFDNGIGMGTSYTPTGSEPIGTTYWDTNNHTTSTVLENGVTLQNGQEVHIWGKNVSGAPIANGAPVSIVSANGSFTAFGAVDITTPAAYAFVGLATQAFGINDFGYVTKIGVVRDLDTTALDEGKPVYVSPTGTLTKTYPTVPNYIINVGVCEYKHANQGRINVIALIVPKLQDLSDVNGTPLVTTGQTEMRDQESGFFDMNANIKDYNSSSAFLRVGLYRNYLLQTEAFDNASWTKVNLSGTVTANTATDPYTGTTAEIIPAGNDATGEVNQAITDSSTGSWTFSVWLKANAGTGTVQISIDSSAETGTKKTVSLTTTWKRYYVTQNFVTANTTKTVRIISGTLAISAWGAMLDNVGYLRRYGAPQTTTAVTTDTTTLYTPNALTALGAITSGAGLSGTTIASSGANTNTQTTIAARDTVEGYITTNTTAATAAIPVQNSPANRFSGTAWDSASRTTNRRQQMINQSGTTIKSRLRLAYDQAAAGYSEVFNTMSDGVSNAWGTTLGTENLTNGALTSGTSWTASGDFALASNAATYTHSTGSGYIQQAAASLAVSLIPYRYYKFVVTTSGATTTIPNIYIDPVTATQQTTIAVTTNGTYTIYFQAAATATDFRIAGASTTTGAVTIDTLSLKEIQSGDFAAAGMFTGGNPNTGIKVNPTSIDFIIQ